jgi:hypothetical protein
MEGKLRYILLKNWHHSSRTVCNQSKECYQGEQNINIDINEKQIFIIYLHRPMGALDLKNEWESDESGAERIVSSDYIFLSCSTQFAEYA